MPAQIRARDGRSFTGPDQNRIARMRTDLVPALSADELRALGVALVDAFATDDGWYTAGQLLGAVSRRRPRYDRIDVALLFELALRPGIPRFGKLPAVKTAVVAAEQFPDPLPELEEPYVRSLAVLEADDHDPGDRAKVRGKLLVLLRAFDPASEDETAVIIDVPALRLDDGWGPYLIDALAGPRSDAGPISAIFDHASTLRAPRPTRSWRRRAEELVTGAAGAEDVLHMALHAATTCPTAVVPNQWGSTWEARVSPANHDILRGLVWSAMALDPRPSWLIEELVALSRESLALDSKVMGASIAAIGETGEPEAVAALVSMQRSTRNKGHLKVIDGALATAAKVTGVSRSELLEITVQDGGLDAEGRRTFRLGDELEATVAVDAEGKVATSWARRDQPLRGIPADAKERWPSELAEVKRAAAAIRKLVAGERARLEDLIGEARSWPIATFEARYLCHPVSGPLARRLIWWVTPQHGGRIAGRPSGEGSSGWVDVEGSPLEVGADAVVTPWHPLTVEPEVVFAWRRAIEALGWRQPFKQAFREIYLLTPAEEETEAYSNRFAAHILDYRQAFALMKERGWSANFLGGWSGGSEGAAKRAFPDHGIQAVFLHDPVEAEGDSRWSDVTLCATDQVRFETMGRGERPTVPLVDVPPMVFSEAMRDVDLFVGVASMANDPTWVDRGTHGHLPGWDRVAFGELTATAETRRDVLEHLLPKLEIADVARLDGRYLVIRGHRHDYKIHLGSGNILMSPNDRYLCIVVDRQPTAKAMRFVPFEGDRTLSVILSKAFLLAADHEITDPTILAQLGQAR